MSLTAEESEGEQNELRNLQVQLDSTNRLVLTLSQQLMELKEQVGVARGCHLVWMMGCGLGLGWGVG